MLSNLWNQFLNGDIGTRLEVVALAILVYILIRLVWRLFVRTTTVGKVILFALVFAVIGPLQVQKYLDLASSKTGVPWLLVFLGVGLFALLVNVIKRRC